MAIGQKYHITQTADGKWQVKGAKAERVLKLFDTQKEAIDYAKNVAGNQEGNIVTHKTDGKIRKQDYSKKSEEQTSAAKETKTPVKETKKAKAAPDATKTTKDVKPAKAAPKKESKSASKQAEKQKTSVKKLQPVKT